MHEDLRERIHLAQAILAASSSGEWQPKDAGPELTYVVNLAGYTHGVPLIVAAAMARPDADALVHCHNLLPQLLADVLAALEDVGETTTTTTMADKLCPKCQALLPLDLDKCPLCGAAV